MTKRSLLAVAIATLGIQSVQAAPFLPMDARGLAMGNTGVASAKRAHAPAYNPSLLSQASEDDDFALLFPQLGVSVADEEELIDEAQTISDDIFPAFEKAVDGVSGGSAGLSANLDTLSGSVQNLLNELEKATPDPAQVKILNDIVKGNFAAVNSDLNVTDSAVNDLTDSLSRISGNPLSARLGVGGALAIPSKNFAAAVSLSGSANVSARVNFTDRDLDLLGSYVPAAQAYLNKAQDVTNEVSATVDDGVVTPEQLVQLQNSVDELKGFDYATTDGTSIIENGELTDDASNADLTSTAEVVAVAVAEVALSFSREFDIAGEKVSFGLTPKLQKVSTFHYADEVDGFEDVESDDIEDSREDYSKVNLDIGASYRFGSEGNWMLGLVGKNLLGGEFDYADVVVTPKDSNGNPDPLKQPYVIKGGSVSLDPQFRAGVAYNSDWFNIAADIDLTENDPVAFENPTQYAAIGAELDIFSTLQLRLGYRTNMSVTDADMVSVGFGLSPFGIHLDIAAMANPSDPEKEAGVALETGFYF